MANRLVGSRRLSLARRSRGFAASWKLYNLARPFRLAHERRDLLRRRVRSLQKRRIGMVSILARHAGLAMADERGDRQLGIAEINSDRREGMAEHMRRHVGGPSGLRSDAQPCLVKAAHALVACVR